MSIKLNARSIKIESEAARLMAISATVNSNIGTLADDVEKFAVLMHSDPNSEFSQDDKTAYNADFLAALSSINAELERLNPIAQLASKAITKEVFLASYTPEFIASCSDRFDT